MARWPLRAVWEEASGAEGEVTDLEMTKLCAEAMGLEFKVSREIRASLVGTGRGYWQEENVEVPNFDPLHNDAQAMALVKWLKLRILPNTAHSEWWVALANKDANGNADLNRAIVECVAEMQAAKAINKGE